MKKRFIPILLAFSLIFSILAPSLTAQATESYYDVSASDWFYDAVNYATEQEIFSGTGGGMFSPQVQMTRGMFVTVLGRYYGTPSQNNLDFFDDIDGSEYYAAYANWAYDAGITSGVGMREFGAHHNIKRQDMVTMLYNYADYIYLDTTNTQQYHMYNYDDHMDVEDYAERAMNWALRYGIIKGKDGNRLDPNGYATRAETAQIFMNASAILKGEEPPVEMDIEQEVEAVDAALLDALKDQTLTPEAALDAVYAELSTLESEGTITNVQETEAGNFSYDYSDGSKGLYMLYRPPLLEDVADMSETVASASVSYTANASNVIIPLKGAEHSDFDPYREALVSENRTLKIYKSTVMGDYNDLGMNTAFAQMVTAAEERGLAASVVNATVDNLKDLSGNGISILSFPYEQEPNFITIDEGREDYKDTDYAEDLKAGRVVRVTWSEPVGDMDGDAYFTGEWSYETRTAYGINTIPFFKHYATSGFDNAYVHLGYYKSSGDNSLVSTSGIVVCSSYDYRPSLSKEANTIKEMTEVMLNREQVDGNTVTHLQSNVLRVAFQRASSADELRWWLDPVVDFDYGNAPIADQATVIKVNTQVEAPPTPEWQGYEFEGWTDEKGKNVIVGVEDIAKNTKYIAKWKQSDTTPSSGTLDIIDINVTTHNIREGSGYYELEFVYQNNTQDNVYMAVIKGDAMRPNDNYYLAQFPLTSSAIISERNVIRPGEIGSDITATLMLSFGFDKTDKYYVSAINFYVFDYYIDPDASVGVDSVHGRHDRLILTDEIRSQITPYVFNTDDLPRSMD